MTLRIHGIEPKTIFGLAGLDENSATFALGWTLEKSIVFRNLLLEKLLAGIEHRDGWLIDLQRHASDGGFTDIELKCPGYCHIIIEAKRNWALPGTLQLSKYLRRLTHDKTRYILLVSISAVSRGYAARHLPDCIKDVKLVHFSWTDINTFVSTAHKQASSTEEKRLLSELETHLQEYAVMQNPRDNMVYVVSLSSKPISDSTAYTWIDVVTKDRCYFHPFASRWPVAPPNYLGFRYYGRLQSVHHVENYEVVENLSTINRNWPETESPHYVYRLGTAMHPLKEMLTGKIYPSGRVYCAIDTLLSGEFETVSDAWTATNKRLVEGESL